MSLLLFSVFELKAMGSIKIVLFSYITVFDMKWKVALFFVKSSVSLGKQESQQLQQEQKEKE